MNGDVVIGIKRTRLLLAHQTQGHRHHKLFNSADHLYSLWELHVLRIFLKPYFHL